MVERSASLTAGATLSPDSIKAFIISAAVCALPGPRMICSCASLSTTPITPEIFFNAA
ncbi:Uncharacterised protein [Vibrio cholerae]|nr:Uncharacterised protein [Vibrio cholerae]